MILEHPIALQLRNLQALAEIAIERNSTIIFPAQFLDSVRALSQFVRGEWQGASAADALGATTSSPARESDTVDQPL